jgi:hypothetical protein
MPFLWGDAPAELRSAVEAMENRADECYRHLRLVKRPANEAKWALLTAMALQLETKQQQYGANAPLHRIRLINLDRCISGFKFISKYGKPASRLVDKYTWHGSLISDAANDLNLMERYTHFLSVLPMWHKNHEQADTLPDGRIRFYIPRDSPRERQVIAFQQGYKSKNAEVTSQYGVGSIAESDEAKGLLDELWVEARPSGTAKKFSYEPSSQLIDALRPKYQGRLDQNFRRADSFQLNGYSLGEFKSFYIAFLILCSIHEYICYPFDKPGQPIPASSLVMTKTRSSWTTRISQISGLPRTTCETVISDLILDATKPSCSMCINPFVPLNDLTLAVAPQFPLASAVDDNILRSFSYLSPALFSAQNTEKEATMRERIKEAAPHYGFEPSIQLPDKNTEIDLLLSDETSSTVVFAELKWIRKPYRTLERIVRDEEVEKGVSQLGLIRSYARRHPDFLRERGKLPRGLDCYANVYYLLVAWDHWYWIEPEDSIATISFEAFLPALKKSTSLQVLASELLKYDWLPVEGRDFRVTYAPADANGAVIESAIFSPAVGD